MNDHACPGCGRPGIPATLLSCRSCWYRLPADLRRTVNSAYAARGRAKRDEDKVVATRAHLRAMQAAMDWWANRPGGSTS